MITSITRHTMITMLIGFALICFTHYPPRAQKTNEAYTAKTENIIFKWLKMVFLSDIFPWMTISETDGIVYSPKEQGMSPLSHISLHWFLDTPNSLFLIPHYPPQMSTEYLYSVKLHCAAGKQHWANCQNLSFPRVYIQGVEDRDSKQTIHNRNFHLSE